MNFIETELKDCYIIEPRIFEDHRGVFFEGFSTEKFTEATGIKFEVKQMNCSLSSKGVIRGLHFQKSPYEQGKIVFVSSGSVLDVAVDLRKNSPTYGKHVKVLLSRENRKRIFVPRGFAHGFVALEENTELNYLVDELYQPGADSGVIYNDRFLNIDWGLKDQEIILSDKDKELPQINE